MWVELINLSLANVFLPPSFESILPFNTPEMILKWDVRLEAVFWNLGRGERGGEEMFMQNIFIALCSRIIFDE